MTWSARLQLTAPRRRTTRYVKQGVACRSRTLRGCADSRGGFATSALAPTRQAVDQTRHVLRGSGVARDEQVQGRDYVQSHDQRHEGAKEHRGADGLAALRAGAMR